MNDTFSNLKIAIVGCGQMARTHARLLKKHLPLENIAACDKDSLRMAEFGKMTKITNLFSDLNQLLKDFKPDIVHVVTPPHTHKTVAILCLMQGCHVLIEKPMCMSSVEADDIMACAQQYKKLVCVDHMRSFDPMTAKAVTLMAQKDFGRVVRVSAHYGYDYLQRMHADPAARWIRSLPGGSFFDLMPHVLCLLRDFLPDLKLEEKFIKSDDEGTITDLQCVFSSGTATGYLDMTLRAFPLKNFIDIECERGTVRVDYRNFLIIHRRMTGLPNFVERILGNISIGSQYMLGTTATVFKVLAGRLDPYAGLEVIMLKFFDAAVSRGRSPVDGSVAGNLLKLTEHIFSTAAKPAPDEDNQILKPADVLVTGATGFIGRPLVRRLLQKGLKVRIMSHRNLSAEKIRKLFGREVEIFRGNIYDAKNVLQAVDGVKKIYHLAAAMSGDWTNHLDVTITGTQNIFRAAESKNVKDIVYVSTLNVYDAARYPEGKEINETFADERFPERRGAYSHAKLIAEQYVREFAKNHPHIRVSVFRPGLVYGPGGRTFPADVGLRISKKLTVVFGLGLRKLPLVYVENLVDALTAEVTSANPGISVFNVIDHDYPNQRRYIKLYRRLTGEKFFVIYVPLVFVMAGFLTLDFLMRLAGKKTSLFYKLRCIASSPRHSTTNAEKLLGWKQNVVFEDGLKAAVHFMNNNQGER